MNIDYIVEPTYIAPKILCNSKIVVKAVIMEGSGVTTETLEDEKMEWDD